MIRRTSNIPHLIRRSIEQSEVPVRWGDLVSGVWERGGWVKGFEPAAHVIRQHLQSMLESGTIQSVGKGTGTRYVLAEEDGS